MAEAEQRKLPSGRAREAVADRENPARVAKARRNAWLLGGAAMLFYVGYMAWMGLRASGG
jgi:hypothetical protein